MVAQSPDPGAYDKTHDYLFCAKQFNAKKATHLVAWRIITRHFGLFTAGPSVAQEISPARSWREHFVQKESQESKKNNKSSDEKEHSWKRIKENFNKTSCLPLSPQEKNTHCLNREARQMHLVVSLVASYKQTLVGLVTQSWTSA